MFYKFDQFHSDKCLIVEHTVLSTSVSCCLFLLDIKLKRFLSVIIVSFCGAYRIEVYTIQGVSLFYKESGVIKDISL